MDWATAQGVHHQDCLTTPLRIALVGCGRWGSRIATTLRELPECQLRWVCDPVTRWPHTAWAPELTDEVCRDVDAVVVATPPDAHVAPVLRALSHRVPVFVEKPFTQSSADADAIARARGNTPMMVGHLLVFHPLYQRLLGLHQTHSLGELRQVLVVRHSPSRGVPRCPWWTLAPHDLALLVRLFGKPHHMNVALTSQTGDVGAELSWDNARATLDYSTTSPGKRRTWSVVTSHTKIDLDESRNAWIQDQATLLMPQHPSPLAVELRHFLRCVATREQPETAIDDALANVALLCAGQRSLARNRRTLVLERSTERHVVGQGSGA